MGQFVEVESVEWPVKVTLPRPGKKKQIEAFNITFHLMSEDERKAFSEKIPDAKEGTQEDYLRFSKEMIEQVIDNIEGWDLTNLEFTPENLEKVVNNHFYLKAIVRAHKEAQSGGELKN